MLQITLKAAKAKALKRQCKYACSSVVYKQASRENVTANQSLNAVRCELRFHDGHCIEVQLKTRMQERQADIILMAEVRSRTSGRRNH